MDKTSLTFGWLVGRQIAGQRRAQEKQPIAYLYNGVILPKLPEWDREAYPYAYFGELSTRTLYVFSEPFVYGNAYTVLSSSLKADDNGKEYWQEWKEETTSEYSRYIPLSEPTPVYLPIVVYDDEVETKSVNEGYTPAATIRVPNAFSVGDRFRITINGVAGEYTVEKKDNQICVGNTWLGSYGKEDDGGDWLLLYAGPILRLHDVYFYTRNPGTYAVKVEWLST